MAANPASRRRLLTLLAGLPVAGFAAHLALGEEGGRHAPAPAPQPAAEPIAQPLPRFRPEPSAADRAEVAAFFQRFLQPDGRILDTGNGNISHSEGQGYGLLLAEWVGDRARFEHILGWTRANLARRGDALHGWRWAPPGSRLQADRNNATDGDLLIAWALLRAADRWNQPAWRAAAAAIGQDILRLATRQVAHRLVLLPGAHGFTQREHVVVNPSYYIFPALRALALAAPDARWARLQADGVALLREARFGQWGLTPDWVQVAQADGRLAPAHSHPARFSYDAVRVPLNLVWAGMAAEPAVAASVAFWQDRRHRSMPAWSDLKTGATSPYAASPGIAAVAQLSSQAVGRGGAARLPRVAAAGDYYAAALTLLVRSASRDAGLALA